MLVKLAYWDIFQTSLDFIWEKPIAWFLQQPLLSQILIIVGIVALVIAAVILVYYILKGVVYLLSYIFKGLHYLFKGIFLGVYKLYELLYYAISGKPREKKQIITPAPEKSTDSIEQPSRIIERNDATFPKYCTECGQEITESLESLLISKGVAFCFYCGNQFKLKMAKFSNY